MEEEGHQKGKKDKESILNSQIGRVGSYGGIIERGQSAGPTQ